MMNLKTLLARFRKDERGVTLVEYGVAVALAVLVGAGALTTLNNEIDGAATAAGAAMPG